MVKNILILGGYGNAGRLIAALLLQHTPHKLILAGRNLEKAEITAAKLNDKYESERVETAMVDVKNGDDLSDIFQKVDLVVVASSTIDYTKQVAGAAVKANIDYFDAQLSSPAKLNVLNSLRKKIEESGLCFITDGGFHPGLPAAMVRLAARQFDEINSANVISYINFNWADYSFSPSTSKEMIDEFYSYNSTAFIQGNWKKLKWSEYKKADFGDDIGLQYVAPMMMDEMRLLPEYFSTLKETGFYVGGFNWFVNYIAMPFILIGGKISKIIFTNPSAKLFEWGLKKFSKPPFISILKLVSTGIKNSKEMKFNLTISHPDAYFLTAAPVTACLLQYFDQPEKRTGLFHQANFVEPKKFFADIEKMGINVQKNLE